MEIESRRYAAARAVASLLGQFFDSEARPMIREMTLYLVELCSGNDVEFRMGLEERTKSTPILPPLEKLWEDVARQWQHAGVLDFKPLEPRTELSRKIMDAYLDLIRGTLTEASNLFISTTGLLLDNASERPFADVQIGLEIGLSAQPAVLSAPLKILIPVTECGHWMLALLIRDEVGAISVTIFDSSQILQGPTRPYTYAYLRTWLQDHGIESNPTLAAHNPQQNLFGVDSGLFVLLGSRLAALEQELPSELAVRNFMPDFRRRVIAELLAQRLDPDATDYLNFCVQNEGWTGTAINLAGGEPTPPRTPEVGFEDLFGPSGELMFSPFNTALDAAQGQAISTARNMDEPTASGTPAIAGQDVVNTSRESRERENDQDQPTATPRIMDELEVDQGLASFDVDRDGDVNMDLDPVANDQGVDTNTNVATSPKINMDAILQNYQVAMNTMALRQQAQLLTPASSEPRHSGNATPYMAACMTPIAEELGQDDCQWSADDLDATTGGVESAAGNESDSSGLFLSDDEDGVNNRTLSDLLGPMTAQYRTVQGVVTFHPAWDDLRDLPTMLALASSEVRTRGVIKICLAASGSEFDVTLDHEVTTCEINPPNTRGYLFLDRKRTRQKRTFTIDPEPVTRSTTTGKLERLVRRWARLRPTVDYITDIDVQERARSGLNLPPSRITNLSNNTLDNTKEQYEGIHTPVGALSASWGTPFSIHLEDFELCAANHLLYGAGRLWIVISPACKDRFELLMRETYGAGHCSQFVHHESIFVLPEDLQRAGIEYSIFTQEAGDVVFTFPGAYYQGFDLGVNFSEAINYSTLDDISATEGYIPCTKGQCDLSFTPVQASGLQPRKRPKVPTVRELMLDKRELLRALDEAVSSRRYDIANSHEDVTETYTMQQLLPLFQHSPESSPHATLRGRIIREQTARRLRDLEARGCSKKDIMAESGYSDTQTFDTVFFMVKRAKCWVELRDMFSDDLPGKQSYAVMCAIKASTRNFEKMPLAEKEDWFTAVRGRRAEILRFLKPTIPSFMFILGFAHGLPKQPYEAAIFDSSREWESWFSSNI